MAGERVRVIINDHAVHEIVGGLDARDLLLEVAEPIVAEAQVLAPKLTGRGAESIHSEDVHDGFDWTVRIGWSVDRYYMRFQDQGTEYIEARNFLELALEGAFT